MKRDFINLQNCQCYLKQFSSLITAGVLLDMGKFCSPLSNYQQLFATLGFSASFKIPFVSLLFVSLNSQHVCCIEKIN